MFMQNDQQTLRHISQADFATVGVNEVAYVRKVQGDKGELYGIFAADGTQLAVAATCDLAWAAIRQNDMEPLSLH
ncbi:MAG TPA: DUF1150 family protein [Kiloniellales bacterium]|nr:DUF1150 family protein [Kiloniellales bacterium]